MNLPLAEQLSQVGQQHLLRFWDELSPDEQRLLAAEIAQIDFAKIAALHQGQQTQDDWSELARRAEPPPAFRLDGRGNRFAVAEGRARGEQSLRAGEIGVVLVAGGQGTRLGFDHPKGMYPIGPVSQATIFQILFEKQIAVRRRYGVPLPLYLMTSPATHSETVAYIEEQGRFGLPTADVQVFCQGTMPAVDAQTGKLLLAEKGRLALSPDGHGGTLRALETSGALADIRDRGIRHLFYYQVDNPLVELCDPEFIGYHLLAGSEMSTQVVAKRTPRDNVGNVVSIDGRVQILEYSELNQLPDEIVLRRDAHGDPVFWAGNIAVHLLDVKFLEQMAAQADSLPFHIAKKKVQFVDEQGNMVEPKQANGKKFERFIFDLLPAAPRAMVMEVLESRSFAPLKNGSGADRDSPETVRAQMVELHTQWLRQAGAQVRQGVPVEISPLFALDAEEAARQIPRDTQVETATYFRAPFPRA